MAYSKTLSNSKTAGPVARVFRDLMMPVALKLFANPKSHARKYDHHIDWHHQAALTRFDHDGYDARCDG